MSTTGRTTYWLVLLISVYLFIPTATGQDSAADQDEADTAWTADGEVHNLTVSNGFVEGVLFVPRFANGIVTGDWSLGIKLGLPTGGYFMGRILGYFAPIILLLLFTFGGLFFDEHTRKILLGRDR